MWWIKNKLHPIPRPIFGNPFDSPDLIEPFYRELQQVVYILNPKFNPLGLTPTPKTSFFTDALQDRLWISGWRQPPDITRNSNKVKVEGKDESNSVR